MDCDFAGLVDCLLEFSRTPTNPMSLWGNDFTTSTGPVSGYSWHHEDSFWRMWMRETPGRLHLQWYNEMHFFPTQVADPLRKYQELTVERTNTGELVQLVFSTVNFRSSFCYTLEAHGPERKLHYKVRTGGLVASATPHPGCHAEWRSFDREVFNLMTTMPYPGMCPAYVAT